MPRSVSELLPGLGLMGVAAAISYGINHVVPLLSSMLIAIILGGIARNTKLIRPSAEPGVAFTNKVVLRTGVVLLGLRLSLPTVAKLGWAPIVVILGTLTVTWFATTYLGRAMKLSGPTRILTATGTGICGAAAVAGMSAVVRPDLKGEEGRGQVDDAAATAVASVTLFGTVALLLFPWLAGVLGLTARQTGVWLGASIHEVGQVVAAGNIAHVTDVAVVTKLGRVVLLAPLIALVGLSQKRSAQRHTGTKMGPIIPHFVAGFLVMVVIRSIFDLPTWLTGGVNEIATILLTAAMAAMGAGVRIKVIASTGGRAIGLGAISATIAAGVSLLLVLALV